MVELFWWSETEVKKLNLSTSGLYHMLSDLKGTIII